MIRTAFVAVAAVSTCAQAQTLTLNEAEWLTAVSGPVAVEDFNDQVDAVLPTGPGTQFNGFSVSVTNDGSQFISVGSAANNIDGTSFLDLFVAPEVPGFGLANEAAVLTFDEPTNAIAFDFADFLSSSFSAGVNFVIDGQLVGNTIDLGIGGDGGAVDSTFIGIYSDTAFTTLAFTSPDPALGDTFGVDNIRYEVPTPAGVAIFSVAGLAAARRRR